MVGRLGDDLDPVVECHTENEFWQLVVSASRRQLFCAPSNNLKTMASAVLLDKQPFDRMGAVAHGGEGAFNGIGSPQVFPVLGREVVERQ
jgi:hypothetical protein